jgi:hypothetical protein
MANELLIRRTAFGKCYLAASENTANHSSNVLTLRTEGLYIPTGAIILGIRTFSYGVATNMSGAKNGTLNAYIGATALGTNSIIASNVILQTVAGSINAAGGGLYVPAGGAVSMVLASSDAARNAIVFDADVYIDYLYCADKDVA